MKNISRQKNERAMPASRDDWLKRQAAAHESSASCERSVEVAVLDADIAGWQSDHEKITEIRETEKAVATS